MKNRIAKKLAAAALAALMTISLTSTAPGGAADAKTMMIGVTSFADTLEPTEQYFSWVNFVMVSDRDLPDLMKKETWYHVLQQSGQTVKTEKTWTFTIRDGVKFSNGNDLHQSW